MIDLSIIIVNWNTRDLLADCLGSVFETAGDLELEVFVVDNASSDGSAAMVREQFPQVRLIENAENVGFARANNQAIRESTGRYVLLLNSDALLVDGAARGMVQQLDEHPRVGIVGARLIYPDGQAQFHYAKFPTIISELQGLVGCHKWDLKTFANMTELHEVDWVTGACLMARREVFDSIGVLDEQFFMFAEEMDLCYRAWQAGWKIAVVPTDPVVHIEAGSTKQRSDRVTALYRSKSRFFRKHYGRAVSIALDVIIVVSAWSKLMLYTALSLPLREYQYKRDVWRRIAIDITRD